MLCQKNNADFVSKCLFRGENEVTKKSKKYMNLIFSPISFNFNKSTLNKKVTILLCLGHTEKAS
jgi:hypothetical protein